jgi:hypothetical protein
VTSADLLLLLGWSWPALLAAVKRAKAIGAESNWKTGYNAKTDVTSICYKPVKTSTFVQFIIEPGAKPG